MLKSRELQTSSDLGTKNMSDSLSPMSEAFVKLEGQESNVAYDNECSDSLIHSLSSRGTALLDVKGVDLGV